MRAISSLLLFVVLAGCQTYQAYPRALRPLAAPLDEPHRATLALTLQWGEHHERRYQGLVTTGPGMTRLRATTGDGTLVFALQQTLTQVNIERTPLLPRTLSADALLADIQLVLWPTDRLASSLSPVLRLQHHAAGRELYRNGTLEVRVHYLGEHRWHDGATLINHRYGYRMTLQPRLAGATSHTAGRTAAPPAPALPPWPVRHRNARPPAPR